jgi:hypothetical protein
MKLLIIILLSFIPFVTFSQISGIVIDRNSGYPVRNSNIRVENQNTGTKSDHEGKFKFKENLIGKSLIISAIGFESQRVAVDKEVLEIYLTTKVYAINEVVVISNNKRDFSFKRRLVSSIRCEPCFETISPGGNPGYLFNINGKSLKKSGVQYYKYRKPMNLTIEFTLSD